MPNQVESDKLMLESRKRLSMTEVSSVDGFNEQTLNLTVNGLKVKVMGENIKITSFNKTTGNLTADGTFNSVSYSSKRQPIIKRLFK